MAPSASVTALDQFEVYNELVRRSRRSAVLSGALLCISALALATAFLSFTRPLPVVVTSDDPMEPRKIVAASATSVREVDALRFMAATAKKLHGWSSATAVSDLTEASRFMTTKWRKQFTSDVNRSVDVPTTIDPSGKTTLLQTYVLSKVRNALEVDWESAKCSNEGGAWHCKMTAILEIQPLTGEAGRDPNLTQKLSIRASFIEVAVTRNTLDGLLIDFWDAHLEGGT